MPFDADIRCAGLFSVELNINSIVEELENLLEKTLDTSQDYEKGGVVWKYVYDLENDYSAHMNSTNSPVNFWEWFTDNYNNVYSYEDLIWEEVDEWCYENHNECICETGGCAKPAYDSKNKDTKEEQIAQAMEWMKMLKESGKPCGLLEDLQHMGPDGTCWREEFNKVLEVVKKEEEEEDISQ